MSMTRERASAAFPKHVHRGQRWVAEPGPQQVSVVANGPQGGRTTIHIALLIGTHVLLSSMGHEILR